MTLTTEMKPVLPGGFVKRSVLPVTAAAKVLGVGRPALSNLLNENASLSPEMALRIEKAFGVKMDTLLRTRFDTHQMREREAQVLVQRFAGSNGPGRKIM